MFAAARKFVTPGPHRPKPVPQGTGSGLAPPERPDRAVGSCAFGGAGARSGFGGYLVQIAAAAGRMLCAVPCSDSIGLDLDIEAAVLAPRSLFLERLSVWRDQESVSGDHRLLAGFRDLPIAEHHQSGNRT